MYVYIEIHAIVRDSRQIPRNSRQPNWKPTDSWLSRSAKKVCGNVKYARPNATAFSPPDPIRTSTAEPDTRWWLFVPREMLVVSEKWLGKKMRS